MNIASFVHKWAQIEPHRPAVALGQQTVYGYSSLSARVARLAGGLRQRGLQPGQHVALLMKNVPQFWECILACWHAGLVAVPINAKLHPREFAYILDQSDSALCFATPGLAEQAAASGTQVICMASEDFEALAAADPIPMESVEHDDLAWLFYTSGTTGQPKGAMLTHRNLLLMCLCYVMDIDDQPPWTAILHPAPLSHGSGMYGLPHFMKGACQVIPVSGGFDPAEIFELIQAWPGCVFFAAPTMIRRLTTHPAEVDSSGLKAIIFGGAPMLVEDIKAYIQRFGPKLAQLYGQGEAPMTISGLNSGYFAAMDHPNWERRIASAGLPHSAVEVLTVDADGNPVASGEIGEIICRSDCVMQGYWKNESATKAVLRKGWLWTGDMGTIDDEGFLTIQDRSKDVIISGGSNIYPREVEEVLLRHPLVAEVSVIGRPDPEWGELVIAYVVIVEGQPLPDAELDRLCLDHIARFKRPKAYRLVPELPKNNYGKILKTTLREWEKGFPL